MPKLYSFKRGKNIGPKKSLRLIMQMSLQLVHLFVLGFGSESDEAEESDDAGGLESDEDEEDKARLMNAKEGIESEDDEDKLDNRKRTSNEDGGGSQRKKKKSRQIVESDEDSD